MIERKMKLSISKQCDLLDVARNNYYYTPVDRSLRYKEVKPLIIDIWNDSPARGTLYIIDELSKKGIGISKKKVGDLMKELGIAAITPKINLSKPNVQHKKYPYLLRGVKITHPNHVWSTDITYIKLVNGFVYLVAIIDWYSRKVLSWRLSNTLDNSFCIDALHEAIINYGTPEIFNTDQGVQFTDKNFTKILKKYNRDRRHQSLAKRTPDEVYYNWERKKVA